MINVQRFGTWCFVILAAWVGGMAYQAANEGTPVFSVCEERPVEPASYAWARAEALEIRLEACDRHFEPWPTTFAADLSRAKTCGPTYDEVAERDEESLNWVRGLTAALGRLPSGRYVFVPEPASGRPRANSGFRVPPEEAVR